MSSVTAPELPTEQALDPRFESSPTDGPASPAESSSSSIHSIAGDISQVAGSSSPVDPAISRDTEGSKGTVFSSPSHSSKHGDDDSIVITYSDPTKSDHTDTRTDPMWRSVDVHSPGNLGQSPKQPDDHYRGVASSYGGHSSYGNDDWSVGIDRWGPDLLLLSALSAATIYGGYLGLNWAAHQALEAVQSPYAHHLVDVARDAASAMPSQASHLVNDLIGDATSRAVNGASYVAGSIANTTGTLW
ncbi:hypothetical protein M231_07311 [Tremella mesenterica]|uniref:Uncharacterized protein n=1 Tax=Tremella mesenterica TaxID=5217 RepID=A0A4Q1BCD0_TREME|nr:hypothetical protein M231_07311 [Tremella mesenterica]